MAQNTTEQPQSSTQDQDQPAPAALDPNVQPPAYQYVKESYNPSLPEGRARIREVRRNTD